MKFRTSLHFALLIAGFGFLGIGPQTKLAAQTTASVLTWHNDNSRTGQNLNETTLTTGNVNSTEFGKVFSFPVDGLVYAQPLYVPNVSIPRRGTFNTVFVATEHDSIYAFDADGEVTTPLWHVSFINPSKGITTISTQSQHCDSMKPEVGITGTPVIDASTGTLYVVAATSEQGKAVQRLHALDITTGREKFGGPVILQANVSGVRFDATLIQRTGLLLLNGTVYIGYASLCDPHPYHGWIFGYSAQNVQTQVAAFVTTPNGDKGGIWQSGAGLAADNTGNIFVMDGDGSFDASTGGSDYGMSMMRLSTASGLQVTDYFTPWNEDTLSNSDYDLGSGGVLLLPTQSGQHPNEALGADKEGKIFVVDRDHMGGFNPTRNPIVQTLKTPAQGYFSTPAYWQQDVYYSGIGDYLSMYPLNSGMLPKSPASHSNTKFGFPGSTPSISANGSSAGIVWAIQMPGNPGPAVLHAYDASNVSNELYNSNQAGNRDHPGQAVKFTVPTVANGRVYVGTQAELDVYGLFSQKP
ncbi:MAG TPA: hypothetical protein VFA89_12345 [Terriglobales bacterium]|nr:hypothetical protein [Terriglobales bacterium]